MCLRDTRRYRSMPALALTSPVFIIPRQHVAFSIARVISTGFLSSLTVRIAYSFLHILNNKTWLRSVESNHASRINSPPPTPCLLDRNTGAGYWNRTNNERLETSSFTIKLIPQIWSGGLLCSDNIRGYLTSYYYTPHCYFSLSFLAVFFASNLSSKSNNSCFVNVLPQEEVVFAFSVICNTITLIIHKVNTLFGILGAPTQNRTAN